MEIDFDRQMNMYQTLKLQNERLETTCSAQSKELIQLRSEKTEFFGEV